MTRKPPTSISGGSSQTGDTKILDNFFPKLYPSRAYTKNFYNYIIEIYNYNKTLGDEEKLTFVGIDIEHRPNITFQCLNEILPDSTPDKSISPSISAIREVTDESYDRDSAYKLGVSLKESMDNYQSIYEDYLKDDYFLFQLIVENLVQGKKAYDVPDIEFSSVRDPFIYKNFERMDSTLQNGKYFGQLGKRHVAQKKNLSVNWFASLLDGEDSKYHDKITSIIYMYRDSKNLTITKDRTLKEKFFGDMTPLFVPIDSKLGSKHALYKLTPDLKISDIDFDIKGTSPSTDYYQYVITIKGSAASTPLDEVEK